MIRQMIKIDEEKCNGCGKCVTACREGAIEIIDGKAKITREDYCDGLGNCLPSCPMDAISFEMREAPAFDEAASLAGKNGKATTITPSGCPGTTAQVINRRVEREDNYVVVERRNISQLSNWPVQIKLAPVTAPYFKGAKLLVVADCTAYAYAAMHQDFIKGHVVLIGCPKLDNIDYSDKLTSIIANNDIVSVSVVRMEVPCCAGLEAAAKKAIQASGKFIPWQITVISNEGKILI